MDLYLYNTLTGKKELFKPKADMDVGMYACGITVYDSCHIGHGRSLYVFSLLKNLLQYLGYNVRFVRNITDIDDKIINRILSQNGNNPISLTELDGFVSEFIDVYYEDLRKLGVPKADYEPRATHYIDKMIEFINKLIDKGYAYATDKGNVYYSVAKFKDYGKLSGRNVDELLEGARKEVEDDKRSALDFALWKAAKENEPFWQSPWGNGRPGWHLECAVMSTDILGSGFDIHGGGMDLIFPHHENEIAEAEPVIGQQFARYWVHHGMVTVNGEKMSKSLGNFITLSNAIEKYGANVLKLWFLSSHYRSPIDLSEDRISDSRKMLNKILSWLDRLSSNSNDNSLDKEAEVLKQEFLLAMTDDINTPKALASIFSCINRTIDAVKSGKGSSLLSGVVREILSILMIGDDLSDNALSLDDDLIELILDARSRLRKLKDFEMADRLRDALSNRDIVIEDTPQGARWFRKIE